MSISTKLNFAIKIKGTEPNIEIWDDSISDTVELTIPAGTYYYNHSNSAYDFVSVFNSIIASYGSVSASNDRQLEFSFTDTSDYLQLPDTDDREIIGEALGLYDNSEGFTSSWEDGDITQITAATVFSEVGYLYGVKDFSGFPNWSVEHFQTEGGSVAAIVGERKQEIDLTLSYLEGDLVAGGFSLGSQSVFQSTLNPNDSVTVWRAYNPKLREPKLYIESETEGNFEYWIRTPITPESCNMSQSGSALYFDLVLGLTLIE